MVWPFLLAPWALLVLGLPWIFRRRPRLADFSPPSAARAPRVSVIVPARNEAHNIAGCVRSLRGSSYPDLEIIVVDDRSEDGTGDIARAMVEQRIEGLTAVEGRPLPPGWLGKPWACWQGYLEADGELLLFADADTRHEPGLLGHAVGALLARDADLVTVLPRQVLASFWERVIMPHFLVMILLRYGNAERISRARDPLDAIANGQFILVRRSAYEAVGGHEAIRGEVVEDQKLAQRFVEAGRRILMTHAEDLMSVRMYRSLREIVEGWTKNVATGGRQAVAPWLRPALPWLTAAWLVVIWIVPPVVFVGSVLGAWGGPASSWSAGATGLSLLFWLIANLLIGVSPGHTLLYPLGAAMAAAIFVRSAVRGERVAWKGRVYGAK